MPLPQDRPRVPPNQHVIPVALRRDLGAHPPFDPANWDLSVEGLVDQRLRLSWGEFLALPSQEQVSDFHCVEGWSVVDRRWEGVGLRVLAETAGVQPEVTHVFARCADGYSTDISLDVALALDTILAYRLNGGPIVAAEGGPVRLVVPRLYAYKSAKFVRAIIFEDRERLGYWEAKGYSNTADPWTDDRRAV